MPNRTETAFFKKYILRNSHCFTVELRKGLCFIDPDTKDYVKRKAKKKINGEEVEVLVNAQYKNPLCIVYFGIDAVEVAQRWNREIPIDGIARMRV